MVATPRGKKSSTPRRGGSDLSNPFGGKAAAKSLEEKLGKCLPLDMPKNEFAPGGVGGGTPRAVPRPAGVRTPRSVRAVRGSAASSGITGAVESAKPAARAVMKQSARANSNAEQRSRSKEVNAQRAASSTFLKQAVQNRSLPNTNAAASVANEDFMSLWFGQTKSVPKIGPPRPSAAAQERTTPMSRIEVASVERPPATMAARLTLSANANVSMATKGANPATTAARLPLFKRARRRSRLSLEDAFVVRCQRKIRESRELDSSEVGVLPIGTIVHVLESDELPDGTQRVRVGRLDNSTPIGWVSRLAPYDDYDALSRFDWLRFHPSHTRLASPKDVADNPAASMHGANATEGGHKDTPSPSRAAVVAAAPPAAAVVAAAPAAAAVVAAAPAAAAVVAAAPAAAAVVTAAPAAAAVALPATTDIGIPVATAAATGQPTSRSKGLSRSQTMMLPQTAKLPQTVSQSETRSGGDPKEPAEMGGAAVAVIPASPPSSKPKVAGKTANDLPEGNHLPVGVKVGVGVGVPVPASSGKRGRPDGIMSAKDLQATADELLKKAETASMKLNVKPDLAAQLGELLHAQSAQAKDKSKFIADLMRDWDPNRDGTITKMEFRANVRKLVPEKVDVKEVDNLFETLDVDKSGEIDISELKLALKRLQDAAAQASAQSEQLRASLEDLHARAARAQNVATLTAQSEQVHREKDELRTKSVGAQLGNILNKKGFKVADLVAKWGGDDGLIDRAEFRSEVNALGLIGAPADVDALFNSFDDDLSGVLDLKEMKTALKKLTDEAADFKVAMKALTLQAADLDTAVKIAQAEWKAGREAELKAEAEEVIRLKREADLRALEARHAMEEKQRIAQAKKEADDAKAAAFEEKIKMKREAAKAKA